VLIELEAGAALPAQPADGQHREWLVLAGTLRLDGQALALRDYHVRPAGQPLPALAAGEAGALVFLRESRLPARPGEAPATVRDGDAGWPGFAPGIRRRVLWHRDGQAAMLYHAEPGASVPSHRHGHDEECLMVQGELFLDDLLLQAGDYQLAPVGSGHRVTQTDTGVVIYAHGDLDLRFD
jgi:quercetin dioxygenase-like cupin family protein